MWPRLAARCHPVPRAARVRAMQQGDTVAIPRLKRAIRWAAMCGLMLVLFIIYMPKGSASGVSDLVASHVFFGAIQREIRI